MPLVPVRLRRRNRKPHPRTWSRAFTAGVGVLTLAGLVIGSAPRGAAEVPNNWQEVARDSFGRTLNGSWGSADLGGAYQVSGSPTQLQTVNGAGVVRLAAGRGFTGTLAKVSAADVNISDTAVVSGASDYDVMHGWGARIQSDGSGYTARVRFSNNGLTSLAVSRLNGSTATWLRGMTLPTTLRTGQAFHGALQVTGTSPVTVVARVWVAGQTKPAWQLSYTDSSAQRITARGAVALRTHVQRANTTLSVSRDDVSVGASSASTTPTEPPAPAPAPAPTTPTSTESGGRGSLPIGSASYAVPAGAIVVDARNGNDSNAGALSSPLRTVQTAVNRASNGKTIVLRAGTYHEAVTSAKTITLQNYPGEAVWFDGSVPIAKWARSGSTWVSTGWKPEFSSSMGSDATFKARFIGSNPMAADPDQVFVNGAALRQVGSAGAVGPGQFHVSDSTDTITIGTDPTGKEVRGSDLRQALLSAGPGSTIQGIGFRRYANGYELGGGLRLNGSGGTVRNVVVEDMATIGISMSNDKKVIDHVTVRRSGQLGIGGHKNNSSVVSNSIVSNNNVENFKPEPVSGGLKFTRARTMTVRNVEVNDNRGTGIWFDDSCYDLTIANNTANGNTKHGIEVEISAQGVIANNQAINGGEDGIILFDSGNFKVFNNEVGGSSLFGIKLAQDERRSGDASIPFLTQNVQLSNNVFGNGGAFQLYALDGRSRRAVDTWNLTVNGNLFNKRVAKANPTMVAWGKGDNSTLERYETPAALAAAKNGGWKNAQIDSSKSITTMGADKTAYAAVAVGIPSDVSAATAGRLAAGSKVLGVK